MNRFTLTLAIEGIVADGHSTTRAISAAIERGWLIAETLGLALVENKAILAGLQTAIVAKQVAAHEAATRRYVAFGAGRSIKRHRPLTCHTAFGTLPLTAMWLRRCRCGTDPSAGDHASISSLADLLPEHNTPKLPYFETRWGALIPYGPAARTLGDMLPMDQPVSRSGRPAVP